MAIFRGLPNVVPENYGVSSPEVWGRTPLAPSDVEAAASTEGGEQAGMFENLARSAGAGLAGGVSGLVGAAEWVTGEEFAVQDTLKKWSEDLLAGTSPEWQAAAEENWISKNDDEWFGSAWGNPKAWGHLIASGLGSMASLPVPGGIAKQPAKWALGKVFGKTASNVAKVTGAAVDSPAVKAAVAKRMQRLDDIAGAAGYGGAEGAMMAGSIRETTKDELGQMPNDLFYGIPEFQEVWSQQVEEKGDTPEAFYAARDTFEQGLADAAAKKLWLPGMVLGAPAGMALNRALAARLAGSRAGSFLKALTLEAPTEAGQGALEQYIQNVQSGEVDPAIQPGRDVAESAVREGIGAGGAALGITALSRSALPPQRVADVDSESGAPAPAARLPGVVSPPAQAPEPTRPTPFTTSEERPARIEQGTGQEPVYSPSSVATPEQRQALIDAMTRETVTENLATKPDLPPFPLTMTGLERVEQMPPPPVEQMSPLLVEQMSPLLVEQMSPPPVEQMSPPPVEQMPPAPVESQAPGTIAEEVPNAQTLQSDQRPLREERRAAEEVQDARGEDRKFPASGRGKSAYAPTPEKGPQVKRSRYRLATAKDKGEIRTVQPFSAPGRPEGAPLKGRITDITRTLVKIAPEQGPVREFPRGVVRVVQPAGEVAKKSRPTRGKPTPTKSKKTKEPKFARAPQPEAPKAPPRRAARVEHGAAIDKANEILQKVGLAKEAGVQMHRTEATLPAEVKAQMQKEGVKPGEVKGVFWDGNVHLVSENLASTQELEETILHEAHGHYGARSLFGKKIGEALRRFYSQVGGLEGVKRVAEQAGVDMRPYLQSSRQMPEPQRDQFLAEELVANLQGARAGATLPARVKLALKSLWGAVRRALRSVGVVSEENMTDADIANLLTRLSRAARKGGRGPATEDAKFGRLAKEPVYYSELTRQTEAINQKSNSPEGWKQIIQKNFAQKGVKQEEVQWSGVIEWLDDQKGKVSKEDLLTYLRASELDIAEVRNSGLGEGRYETFVLQGGIDYEEILLTLPTKKGAEYVSPHWDEKNLLVHIRAQDMYDDADNRTLVVEEIQSDWHQAGKAKGYQKGVEKVETWTRWAKEHGIPEDEARLAWRNHISGIGGRDPRVLQYQQDLERYTTDQTRVPDAPLKSSRAWSLLGFKRALRHAAENGFEKIAWTTGDVQVDRYQAALRNAVDSVTWTKTPEGVHLYGFHHGLRVVDTTVKENVLSDAVGKALANQIREAPGQTGVIEGENLTIDDIGMAGFYDRILPNEVKKYVKKWGGTVGRTKVQTGPEVDADEVELWSVDITPSMREAALDSQPMFYRFRPQLNGNPGFHAEDVNRWDRFVYQVVNAFDPLKKVVARGNVPGDAWDPVLAEKTRPGRTQALISEYKQKWVDPILAEIGTLKLKSKDAIDLVDRYRYALHAPEANERLRKINRRRFILQISNNLQDNDNSRSLRVRAREIREAFKQTKKLEQKIARLERKAEEKGDPRPDAKIAEVEKKIKEVSDELSGAFGLPEQDRVDHEMMWEAYGVVLDDAMGMADTEADTNPWAKEIVAQTRDFMSRPSGMTDGRDMRNRVDPGQENEAQDILDELASNPAMPALQKVSDMLDQMNREMVNLRVDSGLITPEEAEQWQRYQHYSPLQRTGYEEGWPARGRGRSIGGKESKVRKGSTLRATQILANTFAQAETAIERSEKNRVSQALYQFAAENPDPDFWKLKSSKIQPSYDEAGNISLYTDQRDADNIVSTKIGGRPFRVVFNERSDNGMMIAKAFKNMTPETGPLIRGLSKVNRFLAMVNTSLSPEFMVTNAFRDLQTAAYNMNSTQLAQMKRKVVKGWIPAFRGLWAYHGKQKDGDWMKWAEDFEKHGGKTGWADIHGNILDFRSTLESELKLHQKGHIPRKAIVALGRAIGGVNDAVENAIRLSAYRTAVESGMTRDRAAELAKELTVDFNQRGMMGQIINSLYLFANASIQGTTRIFQALKSPKVRRAAYYTIAASALLDLLNRSLGGEDDDGTPYYDKILDVSPWIGERSLMLMLPGTKGDYISVPLPWGYNILWNTGRAVGKTLGAIEGSVREYSAMDVASGLVVSAMNAFNPLASGTLMQSIAPTVLDVPVQIAENKTWYGGLLKPEFSWDKRPQHQQYWSSSREPSIWLAQALSNWTGGDEVEGGVVDWSPEHIDLVVDMVTGSAGRFAADLASTPYKALVQQEEVETREVPFLRKVFGSISEKSDQNLYYSRIEDLQMLERKIKYFAQDKTMLSQVRADAGKRLRLLPAMKRIEKGLRELRRKARMIDRAVTDTAKKKAALDTIDERKRELFAKFNVLYARVMFE